MVCSCCSAASVLTIVHNARGGYTAPPDARLPVQSSALPVAISCGPASRITEVTISNTSDCPTWVVPVGLYGVILNGGNGENDAVAGLVTAGGPSVDLDVRAGRQLAEREMLRQARNRACRRHLRAQSHRNDGSHTVSLERRFQTGEQGAGSLRVADRWAKAPRITGPRVLVNAYCKVTILWRVMGGVVTRADLSEDALCPPVQANLSGQGGSK